MRPHLDLWAKLGHHNWPEHYHPLVCHLIDVAAVAQLLWDRVLLPPLKRRIASSLGFTDLDTCGRWLAFFAGSHDIGKACPWFQARDNSELLRQRLIKAGMMYDGNDPHGVVSTIVLANALAEPLGWPKIASDLAQKIAVAVGGHHGVFPTSWVDRCGAMADMRKERVWRDWRMQMLAELAAAMRLSEPEPRATDGTDQTPLIFLAGLTSVADWIGSQERYFPAAMGSDCLCPPDDPDAYARFALERAELALREMGWLHEIGDQRRKDFMTVFADLLVGQTARPLQTKVESIARDLRPDRPGLFLIEAPMGEGKTEAALFIAHAWHCLSGQGTYVALPTMATSNQMFQRVEKYLHGLQGRQNVMLLHGKSLLNETFEKMRYRARLYDQDQSPSQVVAEEWFASNKKHGLLARHGVGTIDQMLLAALQTKHMFVRLFGLAGKCVIIDECHAYDTYMSTLLERLLSWLAALGCPVVLLSATLPLARRRALLRAYAGNQADCQQVRYPRVTSWFPGEKPMSTSFDHDSTRARSIRIGWQSDGFLARRISELLRQGGCLAVIRNTVGLAQETFQRLKNELPPDVEIQLFHARFPFGRRNEIEGDVLAKLGKGVDGRAENPHRPIKYVLVATQVIEQSLDLDFDMMLTDLAPIDLILQRAGRLWRHDRGARPTREPALDVIQPELDEFGVPKLDPHARVYAAHLLLRSYCLIEKRLQSNGFAHLPDDIDAWIEDVYGDGVLPVPDAHWQDAITREKRRFDENKKRMEQSAKTVFLRRPDDDQLLEAKSLGLDDDDQSGIEHIHPRTRDAQPTLRIIVLYQIDGRLFLKPDQTLPVDLDEIPDGLMLRHILDNEITINHPGRFQEIKDLPEHSSVPSGWRRRGLLKSHRTVTFDANGIPTFEQVKMKLDPELGLIW